MKTFIAVPNGIFPLKEVLAAQLPSKLLKRFAMKLVLMVGS